MKDLVDSCMKSTGWKMFGAKLTNPKPKMESLAPVYFGTTANTMPVKYNWRSKPVKFVGSLALFIVNEDRRFELILF